MPKFMCSHALPPGKLTADQVREIQQATQIYVFIACGK